MKHSTVLLIVSAAVLNLMFTGCGSQTRQRQQDESPSVQGSIEADCIVHYYKSNASAYITAQQHRFNPQAGFFQASSKEPVGTVQCSLVRDVFDSSELKKELLSDLPGSFWNQNLATVLFYSFCAGGDLLDTASMTAGENVKIDGQWYKPFTPAWPTDVDVKVLQSLDSRRVEAVELTDVKKGSVWLVRCYNHRFSRELDKRLPRTIDVYDIVNGIASKELMIRFDYSDIRKMTSAQQPD
jgi:hypothetical protein